MLKTKSNALRVVEATLGKITGVKKPISKFIIHITGVMAWYELSLCFQQYGAMGQHDRKKLSQRFW